MSAQPRLTKRDDVQGLRALAVVLVILYHTGLPVSGGFVGVDAFFVISGFVITRMLWAEYLSTGRLDLPNFYARRVRRLLPALAILLVFVALAAVVLESPLGGQQQTALTGAAASVFAANAELFKASGGYFDRAAQANPLLHTWTLAVEEQFYLVFPALLILAIWLRRRLFGTASPTVVAFITVASVLAVSFAASAMLTPSHAKFAFYASPLRAWEFASGGLVALAEPRFLRIAAPLGVTFGLLGLGFLGIPAFSFSDNTQLPGTLAVLPVLGTVLLVLGGMGALRGVSAALAWAPLTRIGDMSYGWYLWHWPFVVYTRAVWPDAATWLLGLAALIALLPTALSYRFIEQPVRSNRRLVGRRALALAVACAAGPVLVFAALTASTRFPDENVGKLVAEAGLHAGSNACSGNLPTDAVTTATCSWMTSGSGGTVYLVGDSQAGQFVEPAALAANKRGLNLVMATFDGCPFADLTIHYSVINEEACRYFVDSWTETLTRSRPALILLASASSVYLHAPTISFEAAATHDRASTPSAKAVLWQEAMAATVQRLSAAGAFVVLIHPVPQLGSFDLLTCPAFRIHADPASCGTTVSKSDAQAFNRSAFDAEEKAIERVSLAASADFVDDICPGDVCAAFRDGRWVYRDGGHLSIGGAMKLAPRFEQLLKGAIAVADIEPKSDIVPLIGRAALPRP